MTRARTPTRGFRLVVEAVDTDSYGLRLEQTNGNPEASPVSIAAVRASEVEGVAETLHHALRESRQPRTALSAGRRKPIALDESAGVRLALALIAAKPITKRSRREAILMGIAGISPEETYYWFAKMTGPSGPRSCRALRILLADDGRTGITA
ncbi:MAG: DUF7680 family protein [Acidimicrobiales bacterium]